MTANNSGLLTLSTDMDLYVFLYNNTGLSSLGKVSIRGAVEHSNTTLSKMMVMASPQLTKFGTGFTNSTGGFEVVARSVDFNNGIIEPVQFSDPLLFFGTVQGIDGMREIDFNDWYFVVRNGSKSNVSDPASVAANPPVEQVWQIVGKNFTFIRQRFLTNDTHFVPTTNLTRELATFMKCYIDPSVTSKAVVIDVYVNDSMAGYVAVEWDYGNFLSNNQVIQPATPPYMVFKEPLSYANFSSQAIRQWVYLSDQTGDTNITVFTLLSNASLSAHFHSNETYLLTGQPWKLLFQNDRCKVFRNGTAPNNISMIAQVAGVWQEVRNFTDLLGGINLTGSSNWTLSEDCSRFGVDSVFGFRQANGSWAAFTLPAGFTLKSVDRNLSYALGNDSSIYRFNMSTASLSLAFTPPMPFPPNSTIRSSRNIVGVGSTNTTSAWFTGFLDQGNFSKCINYSFHNFTTPPIISSSPSLNKIFIFGMANPPAYINSTTPIPRVDMFFINCPTFHNITFPTDQLQDPANSIVNVGDKFVYIVNLNAGNPAK
jgi:hypothetical protein